MKQPKRPKIPDHIKLELWAKSGGRCQFQGCNKPLWHDQLTMNVLNQSNIAHIISWTPDGPRGHQARSNELKINICNLMMMCLPHHREIDEKQYELRYPETKLLEWKKEHEKRIEIVTGINSEHKSELLIFKANIGNNIVDIDHKQAFLAIIPYYSTERHPFCIDLTTLDNKENEQYWATCFDQIKSKVGAFLSPNRSSVKFCHISIFALAPIPFLIKLGHCLGDTIPMRLFQKHRDTDDWIWKKNIDRTPTFKKFTSKLKGKENIALVFSLSGKIEKQEYFSDEESWGIIEVSIDRPNTGFLQTENQMMTFRAFYREILTDIRKECGRNVKVHIFPAIPAPIAVEIGRSILPKSDPEIYIYDKQKNISDKFIFIGKL